MRMRMEMRMEPQKPSWLKLLLQMAATTAKIVWRVPLKWKVIGISLMVVAYLASSSVWGPLIGFLFGVVFASASSCFSIPPKASKD